MRSTGSVWGAGPRSLVPALRRSHARIERAWEMLEASEELKLGVRYRLSHLLYEPTVGANP